MAKINDIKNIIASAAAKNNMPTYENGNIALKVAEPVISLQTVNKVNQKNLQTTSPTSTLSPTILPSPQELRQFIKNNFVENRDFMRLPGIPKPVLTKAGSVLILRYMGLRAIPHLLSAVFDHPEGVISYTVEVTLVNAENHPIVSAIGASSTAEKKYAKSGIDAINTVCNMAYKRALIAAVKLLL